ncbi:NAD(P)-dependent alcohol dehydrogenase [Algoriphagus namhaensis]
MPSPEPTMNAILFEKYGRPESVLRLTETPRPIPKGNQVLVKIKSTSINDYDWSVVRGLPKIYRLMFGLGKPKNPVPGMELSGIIEALGPEASKFIIGDPVFGDISHFGFGSFAEYVAISEDALRLKPEGINFDWAAALPHAACLAYQGLFTLGELTMGQKILINGAGGGVGTLALQLAKHYDCHVTGVDAGQKLASMKSMGFDEVIDYQKTDFTSSGERYDLILDCKSTRGGFALLKCLSPQGKYITIGGSLGKLINILFIGLLSSPFTGKRMKVLALKENQELEKIAQLVIKEKLKPQIDGPYRLDEVPACIQHFGEGKHLGKVIIRVS